MRLDDHSEPEPDLAVLVPRSDYYASGHPRPADVLPLIEVADTSLEQNHTLKLPLYARAGVPAVWLVDLTAGVVDTYREPSPDGYLLRQRHRRGQSLSVPIADVDLSLAVDDVIPADETAGA